jgi:hypothetical protein
VLSVVNQTPLLINELGKSFALVSSKKISLALTLLLNQSKEGTFLRTIKLATGRLPHSSFTSALVFA